ncbi:SpoIIAA-like [Flavobacterium flevense]|uniref:STAS/SEC14 domain-containing protein n=1 Tax=Flavobacterium flevense TaxID=983 RepID=A0A4Y4AQH7_9FLAO|nr:STAS/SEC14 domain-containing protein [Flavobacterium flevense]GEC70498.1 hypothetical protein FFL01_00370 [Flavobacterium flevense]SHL62162.1 SpoIIAA-like [Flavobacterium flevense]
MSNQNTIVPAIKKLAAQTNEINFILYLDIYSGNFTTKAWCKDALLNLKSLGRWNRSAIITDSSNITSFTKAFSYLVPGEFKGFTIENYEEAVLWVSSTS